MTAQQAKDCVAWLNGLNRFHNIQPVMVVFTFRGKDYTYYGARYERRETYNERHPAVERGDRVAGAEYFEPCFYLLGRRAAFMQERVRSFGDSVSKYDYNFPGDDGDWYSSCYWEGGTNKEYHPFGRNFMLSRWPHEDLGRRIDHYDAKKRERVKARFEIIS